MARVIDYKMKMSKCFGLTCLEAGILIFVLQIKSMFPPLIFQTNNIYYHRQENKKKNTKGLS